MEKEYFVEFKTGLGWKIYRLGKFRSYKECRKAVNREIESLCKDNDKRRFRMYPKGIQILMCISSKVCPGGTKLSIKKVKRESLKMEKYENKMGEFFKI